MDAGKVQQALTHYFTHEGYGTKGKVAAWFSHATVVLPILAGLALAFVATGRACARAFSNKTEHPTRIGELVQSSLFACMEGVNPMGQDVVPVSRAAWGKHLNQNLEIREGSKMPQVILKEARQLEISKGSEKFQKVVGDQYRGVVTAKSDDGITLAVEEKTIATVSEEKPMYYDKEQSEKYKHEGKFRNDEFLEKTPEIGKPSIKGTHIQYTTTPLETIESHQVGQSNLLDGKVIVPLPRNITIPANLPDQIKVGAHGLEIPLEYYKATYFADDQGNYTLQLQSAEKQYEIKVTPNQVTVEEIV